MKFSTPVALATAAISAAPVLATTATVHNQCSCDIFVWSVGSSGLGPMTILNPGNPTYTETIANGANSGGKSIKVAKINQPVNVTQFEYTIGGDGNVYYDLSIIDGFGIIEEGANLVPSISSCPTVDCPAGAQCDAAYINPDDVRTKGCSVEADLVMTICPNGDSSAPAVSSSAAAPSPTTTSAPAPSSTSAPASSSTAALVASSSSASPVEMFEETPTEAVTWHSVSKRRGHGHGHRFARP